MYELANSDNESIVLISIVNDKQKISVVQFVEKRELNRMITELVHRMGRSVSITNDMVKSCIYRSKYPSCQLPENQLQINGSTTRIDRKAISRRRGVITMTNARNLSLSDTGRSIFCGLRNRLNCMEVRKKIHIIDNQQPTIIIPAKSAIL